MSARKEWMLGIPGHNELVNLDQVLLLLRGGQLRPTDLVKKLGEPWRAANEVTELAPHFTSSPPSAPPRPLEPIPLKANEAQRGEPIRTTTDRVPRMGGKIPDSSKTLQKVEPKPEAPAGKPAEKPSERPAEDRSPIRSTTSRVGATSAPPKTEVKPPPPKEEKKEERKVDPRVETKTDSKDDTKEAAKPDTKVEGKKSETKAGETKTGDTKAETDPTDKISGRKLGKRDLPKAPPKAVPKIEPMVPKYYSPVDLLRSASFSFEPKKLMYCLPVVPLMMLWSLGMSQSQRGDGIREGVLFFVCMAFLVFGLAFILTGLSFVSRRQCEGRDYYFSEVVHHAGQSVLTAVVYPILSLAPSLLSLLILYLLGLARNRTQGLARTIKVGYILPMIFAFVTVLGALVYQIASMYVPAAGVVEGEGLGGSIHHAWSYVRRQWGRVVLHWLIVTVAFGVITAVFLGLSYAAIKLPEKLWWTDDRGILEAFDDFSGIKALYEGLAYGLGMMLPISLFSTLGMLSYLLLRTPAGAQLSPSYLDDTSGMEIGAMRGTRAPGESTNPSDTRPAPLENTAPLSDISDDSDEQPLVKD
jgi:hypothetical protein